MINFEIPIILAVIFLIALWWNDFFNYLFKLKEKKRKLGRVKYWYLTMRGK